MIFGETAPRDENQIPALLATDSTTGNTTVKVYADPATHRLLVDSTSGVVPPVSSTDKAVARFNGTTGATIQNSLVIISDTGALSGVTNIVSTGTWAGTNILATGFVNAASYEVSGVNGASGTFTTVDLKTVTVVGGIITSIV